MAHNKDGYSVEKGQIERTFTPRKTRSEHRNDATWADVLAVELEGMGVSEVERLPLTEQIREAVLLAQTIRSHGAKRRQMLYVSKLLRAIDPEPIRAALDDEAAGAAFEELERWRDRILRDGDGGISVFLAKYPRGDRLRLRQAWRSARADDSKGMKAKKLLFQLLREATGI